MAKYKGEKVDDRFFVTKGDLLIAMSGATTGKMGVYSYEETAYLNQRVANIRILDDSILLASYRDYFMQSKVEEILKLAYGGAQPNISANVVGNFDFLLPFLFFGYSLIRITNSRLIASIFPSFSIKMAPSLTSLTIPLN